MLFKKIIPSASRVMVRRISLFCFIVPSLVMLLICRWLLPLAAVCHLLMSSSVLLMIPDTFNDVKFSACAGFSVLVLSVAADVIAGTFGAMAVLAYAYPLIGAVPLFICVFHRARMMMQTPSYLVMKISGWELMLCIMKSSFLLMFMIVSDIVLRLALSSSSWYVYCLSAVISLALYMSLYVRSITSGPIISFTIAGVPHGERDVESCADLPKSSRVDYSLMYDRMCRLMDEKKPYLNPYYSLEDLVRSLISNKAYVSKLIHTCTGLNFSQMINKYRVGYARELYAANPDLKVKDLSDMSGFHSQVTFNMAFKLFYDMTPGMWCKEYRDGLGLEKCLSSQEESEPSLPQGSSVSDA